MASVVDRLAEALGAEGGLARATAAGLLVYAAASTALLLWIAVTYTIKPIPAKVSLRFTDVCDRARFAPKGT